MLGPSHPEVTLQGSGQQNKDQASLSYLPGAWPRGPIGWVHLEASAWEAVDVVHPD